MMFFTRRSELLRFTLLFAALYAAFGAVSPFLPLFLLSRGLVPEQVGLVLALAMAVRLLSAPLAARLADRLHALRALMAACAAMGGAFAIGYFSAFGLLMLLAISLGHAAALAPTSTLADALALDAAMPRGHSHLDSSNASPLGAASPGRVPAAGFEYGWVRGTGSATFIAGTLASAQAIRMLGFASILIVQAVLLMIVVIAALCLSAPAPSRSCDPVSRRGREPGVLVLVRMHAFRRLVIAAALIVGSHAMYESFAMIGWHATGIGISTGSILWSESVAAEVAVFLGVGPLLLRHLKPETAMAIAAIAAALRWIVMAQTPGVPILAAIEPLHGLTFALLHLSCMRVLAIIVPRTLAGTALAIYGWVGMGSALALLTLVSGELYARLGFGGFWVMAALALAALPAIWGLNLARSRPLMH